mmetsp:Transcript_39420/g.80639  ORF Transcript_39420/g.80639 Transcript_39420/m.80639 type:complete len:305 (+) Transcript_39420:55-969(+)
MPDPYRYTHFLLSLSILFGSAACLQRAIVFTTQRSGSAFLGTILNKHREVEWGGESVISYSYMSAAQQANVTWTQYRSDLESGFSIRQKMSTARTRLIGFKITYDQIPSHLSKQVFDYFAVTNTIVLHLVREATILNLASHLQSIQDVRTGQLETVELKKGKKRPNSTPVSVTRRQLGELFNAEDKKQMNDDFLFVRYKGPYMRLTYELLSGIYGNLHFSALSGFLNLSSNLHQGMSTLQKIHDDNCQERIVNFNDLVHSLRGRLTLRACAALLAEKLYTSGSLESTHFNDMYGEDRYKPSVGK